MEKTIFGQKCIIYNKTDRTLLLLKRSNYKDDAHKWDLVGGSVNFGEDSKISIKREAKEETGMILNDIKIIDLHSRKLNDGNFFIFALYYCDNFTYLNDNLELSHEHQQFQWVNIDVFQTIDLRSSVDFVRDIIVSFIKTELKYGELM